MLLPENNYWCAIESAILSESTEKKTPQVTLTLKVESEQGDADEVIPLDKAETRTCNMFLSEASWPYTEKKLAFLGFNGDFDDIKFTEPRAWFECRHEEYKGKQVERWELAGGGGKAPEKASSDVIRTFNAKWKQSQTSKAPAAKPKAPPKPGRAAPPPPINQDADDVPFNGASAGA